LQDGQVQPLSQVSNSRFLSTLNRPPQQLSFMDKLEFGKRGFLSTLLCLIWYMKHKTNEPSILIFFVPGQGGAGSHDKM
jgi:hypothetical protein